MRCHLVKNSISDATTIEISDDEQEMVKAENEYVVVKSNPDAFDDSTDTDKGNVMILNMITINMFMKT